MTRASRKPTQSARRSQSALHAEQSDSPDPEPHKLAPRQLLAGAARLLVRQRKLLGGILFVYALARLLLVGSVSATDVQSVKSSLTQSTQGHPGTIHTGATLLAALLGSGASSGNNSAGAYEAVLFVVLSVVFIWALRQVYAKKHIRVRDAYYQGTSGLIPFTLVLLVIGLEVLPLVIAGALYRILSTGGIAAGPLEHAAAWAILIFGTGLTLYMLASSVFALYIATLPNMTPLVALRRARELVRGRRRIVLLHILFLMIVIAVACVVPTVLVAIYATPLSPLVLFVLETIAIGVAHSYLYGLYRDLLPTPEPDSGFQR